MEVLQGKYRIIREIARSNDIVYEATEVATGRRVALKELNIAPGQVLQEKQERIARFQRESRAAGQLNHPNVVSVYQAGEENGRYFFAMEFLEGQSLRDKLGAVGSFPLRDALVIFYQLLDALTYAHQRRVVHRDIKPDNIHILPGGQVKLTDFGIARLTDEAGLTSAGQVFGTPSYMSPEQIVGGLIDARSDIFSAGILLYEMLAGRKPFVGDNVVAITYAIMNSAPASLTGIPSGIEAAILRAMSKSPLHRFTTADEMKAELKRAETSPAHYGLHGSNSTSGVGAYPSMTGGYQIAGMPGLPGAFGYPPPQNLPSSPGNSSGSQPWAYNNGSPGSPTGSSGNTGTGQRSSATGAVIPPGGFGAIPGQNPLTSPFPQYKSPSIVLSPGMKTFLFSILLASVLGGGIALGVIAFMRGYENYKVVAGSEQITQLVKQGKAAYEKTDYEVARQKFEAARQNGKDEKQLQEIYHNLAATYIALGNKEMVEKNWEVAKTSYEKAIEVADDELLEQAKRGRGDALEHLGKSRDTPLPPPVQRATESRTNAPPQEVDTTQTVAQDRANAQAKAKQLIAEGEKLLQTNNIKGAREKWLEAVRVAPGTSESQTARQRLNEVQEPTPSGGDNSF